MKFFKKLGLKLQLLLLLTGGVIAAFIFLSLGGNLRIKRQMKYELDKVKKETQLAELEEDTEETRAKIEDLKKQEKIIEEKIRVIEEKEAAGEDIGLEDLEKFFNDRGF